MKYCLPFLLLVALYLPSFSQSGTEILLFELKEKKKTVTVSRPRNITNHKGYDNQPHFHSALPYVFYSSFDAEDRADILRYNYKTNEVTRITTTREREYSPTLTPDKQYLSCIIQRDNNAQDLGKYPVDGGEPSVIINNLVVGYHVWADDSHVALFVLGPENSGNALHYMRLPTKHDTIVATNIGRSLHKIPGQRAISFIQKSDESIMRLDMATLTISKIAPALKGVDHITWTPKGMILSSDGKTLFFLDPASAEKNWKAVAVEEGGELLKGVTRLAVSAKGDKLAVVVSEE